jgi:hypothetical protein
MSFDPSLHENGCAQTYVMAGKIPARFDRPNIGALYQSFSDPRIRHVPYGKAFPIEALPSLISNWCDIVMRDPADRPIGSHDKPGWITSSLHPRVILGNDR